MIRLLLILAAITAPILTYGKVSISKQYLFPVSALEGLEIKIQAAFEREAELQEYPLFYEVDSKNGISLWCPPHQPDAHGNGCLLNFSMKMQDDVSILMRKKLVVKGKSKDIGDKLSLLDPNTVQEHQHFGSIFDPQDTFASHYFCEPDGINGSKIWQCFLYVSESFN